MEQVKHYVLVDGEQVGPLSFTQLKAMYLNASVTLDTLHFMDGYTEWLPLEYMVEEFTQEPMVPIAGYERMHAAQRAAGMDYPARSRGIYIIIGLFLLGLVGGHNFYIGRYSYGVAQLILSFILWLVLKPLLLITAIWVIFDLCLIRKDGRGKLMI